MRILSIFSTILVFCLDFPCVTHHKREGENTKRKRYVFLVQKILSFQHLLRQVKPQQKNDMTQLSVYLRGHKTRLYGTQRSGARPRGTGDRRGVCADTLIYYPLRDRAS